MKLTVKTLNQKTIEIEIDAEKTVRDLKVEIAKKLGDEYKAELQKLICTGVVMEDAEKISFYNITPDKFIVVMLIRNQATNHTTQSNLNSRNDIATQMNSDAEPNFQASDDYKQAIDIMVEMGFDRTNVEQAMAVSNNNPELAFEYLTTAIPDDIEAAMPESASAGASPQINTETVNQVLELLRQNPNLLTATLQQMGVTNSELLQQIQNNPNEFFNLMRQLTERNSVAGGASGAVSSINNLNDNSRPSAAAAGQAATVASDSALAAATLHEFTPADHAAIDRLKAMGFQELMAIQAYVAFDKNEAMAADFLASSLNDQN